MVSVPARRRLLPLVAITGLLLLMTFSPVLAQVEGTSVRVVHGIHGAGPVDVYINGDPAIEALEYAEVTEYLDTPAGDYNLRVVEAGEDPDTAMIEMDIALDSGLPHTVVTIGPPDTAEAVVIIDDHTPPSGDLAKLSLINATSDGTDVTLLSGGESLVGDVPAIDASEYVELDAGSHDLSILTAAGNEIATLSGVSLDAGGTYSVFALGIADDYEAVLVADAGAGTTPPEEPTATPTAAGDATPPAETPTAAATADADETPSASPTAPSLTPTPEATATPTVLPSLPATGAGGAGGGNAGMLSIAVGALIVLLTGLGVWRLRAHGSGIRG